MQFYRQNFFPFQSNESLVETIQLLHLNELYRQHFQTTSIGECIVVVLKNNFHFFFLLRKSAITCSPYNGPVIFAIKLVVYAENQFKQKTSTIEQSLFVDEMCGGRPMDNYLSSYVQRSIEYCRDRQIFCTRLWQICPKSRRKCRQKCM